MVTPVYLKSLVEGTPVYAWQAGQVWTQLPPTVPVPSSYFTANQVGLQVGTFAAVDVDSFRSLLGTLPSVHSDLYLDAVEVVGLKNYRSISQARWGKLSLPRPARPPYDASPKVKLYAYNKATCQAYQLGITDKGAGGWYEIDRVPDDRMADKFSMWDYDVYVPEGYSEVTLHGLIAKRLITATFDHLFCYNLEDASLKAYLAYAQPIIDTL